MQHEAARKAERGEAAQERVQRRRRGAPFSHGADNDAAVQEDDDAVAKAVTPTQKPADIAHQGASLLEVDVLRVNHLDAKHHLEVTELQAEGVPGAEARGELLRERRSMLECDVVARFARQSCQAAEVVVRKLRDGRSVAERRGSVSSADEGQERAQHVYGPKGREDGIEQKFPK